MNDKSNSSFRCDIPPTWVTPKTSVFERWKNIRDLTWRVCIEITSFFHFKTNTTISKKLWKPQRTQSMFDAISAVACVETSAAAVILSSSHEDRACFPKSI